MTDDNGDNGDSGENGDSDTAELAANADALEQKSRDLKTTPFDPRDVDSEGSGDSDSSDDE